ncbi:MAG: hypothetical protein DME25_10705 [Verrucomicrobia bacterium]|nr:MAG: hypothetical protein DME25_10705 [Verrucomicrobiota bacterium]
MKNLSLSTSCVTVLIFLTLLAQPVHAAPLYWDRNGSTSGAGGPSPSGAWDQDPSNLSLSTDPAGASSPYTTNTVSAPRRFFRLRN